MDRLLGCDIQGAGPGAILLHGSLGSRSECRALAAELSRDHTVLTIDLLGYGEAALPHNLVGFSLADEATRVLAYAGRVFGPGAPFLLAGHGYGGAVALEIARLLPTRVAGLAVFEPECLALVEDSMDRELLGRLCDTVEALVEENRLRDAARLAYDFWHGPEAFRALPAAKQLRLSGAARKLPLDFQALREASDDPAAYAGIAAPVLLAGGTQSFGCMHRVLARLSRALPHAECAWIEGDHAAMSEAPGQSNPRMAGFLRSAVQHFDLALAA